MISVTIRRNNKSQIYGFTVKDHGETDACAAVSLLTLNTVNSIESLTVEPIVYDYDPEGGFLQVVLPQIKEGNESPQASLLLEAMALGLDSVKENYSSEIALNES